MQLPVWRGQCAKCGIEFDQTKVTPDTLNCQEHRTGGTYIPAPKEPELAENDPVEAVRKASVSAWDMSKAPAPEISTRKRSRVFTD